MVYRARTCRADAAVRSFTLPAESPSDFVIPRPPSLPKDLRIEVNETPPSEPPPGSRRAAAFFAALTDLQVRRPFRVLLVSLLVTVVALGLAVRLRVLTGFENLLPEDRPSVRELSRVAAHTAGVSMMFVVLRSPDDGSKPPTQELRRAADAIVDEAKKLGPPWVGSTESGVHDAIDFLGPRAGLYGDREKLEQLRTDIDARYVYEVNKATGTDLGFDEPPPAIDLDRIQKTFGVDRLQSERYPDGYYQSKDGRTLVVAIRSKIPGSDLARGTEAIRKVRDIVERVDPKSYDPRITYGLTGDLVTAVAEYKAINDDLRDVGILGAFLITAVVLIYYLRLRTLVTMLLTMCVGVAWTFGLTEVLIGHLNLATGFLFTIVAGNGINAGIIFMARYLEERKTGATLAAAVETAHRETWLPTLTAAGAASASFASLLVTEFRGFRDFGLIGGFGMLICWVATYWTLPAILAVTERVSPIDARGLGGGPLARLRKLTQGGVGFGMPFAAIVKRAPRTVGSIGVVLAAAGVVAGVVYVRSDPMEYDLRQLRTDPKARAETIELSAIADAITGHVGADGMAILVDDPAQVPLLEKKLRGIRDAAPSDRKPFSDVHALQDFVPSDQAPKIPTLLGIKDRVMRSRRKGLLKDQEFRDIERFIPGDDLAPFTMDDLPEEIARIFTESDGRRGRVVYISPTDAKLVDDAHYLFRWADSYRETKLSDGSVVLGSGRAVIYADMWSAVIADVPKAVLCSLVAVIAAVMIAFRAGRPAIAVLGGLAIGVAWMALVLVLLRVKLNFLNFIALPITFGIGVDYAVNIVQRYVRDGVGSAVNVVRETGGAVVLCSLTTTLGYFALVGSNNYGVRSLGVAAVIGEVCCLLAAVLVVPAALVWFDRNRAVGEKSSFSHPPPRPSKAPSLRPSKAPSLAPPKP